jgi:hypothetical protein
MKNHNFDTDNYTKIQSSTKLESIEKVKQLAAENNRLKKEIKKNRKLVAGCQ